MRCSRAATPRPTRRDAWRAASLPSPPAGTHPMVTPRASISGFTFLRNGTKLGFPFEASIRSLLPLVDEFVIAVGQGDDDTRERLVALGDPKIRIVDTVW